MASVILVYVVCNKGAKINWENLTGKNVKEKIAKTENKKTPILYKNI